MLTLCYTVEVKYKQSFAHLYIQRGGENHMKENIHPKYFITTCTCACGATFETGSTKENLRVEICSKCHPFTTGVQRIVDTGGRVEKFKKKHNLA